MRPSQFDMSAFRGDPFWGVTALNFLVELFGEKEIYSKGDLMVAKEFAHYRAATLGNEYRNNLMSVEQVIDQWLATAWN